MGIRNLTPKLFVALVASWLFFAILSSAAPASQKPPVHVSGSGRVIYLDNEGGFYGIICDNGTTYDPVNLPGDYQVDELRVKFNGTVLANQTGIHMWGTMITIDNISGLETKSTDSAMTLVILVVPIGFVCALMGRVLWLRGKNRPPVK